MKKAITPLRTYVDVFSVLESEILLQPHYHSSVYLVITLSWESIILIACSFVASFKQGIRALYSTQPTKQTNTSKKPTTF